MIAVRSRRYPLVVLTLVLAASFAALAAPKYLLLGDPDHYVELARAITRGGPYAVNGRPEVKFPPGLPLVLAPAALLFKGSFAAISRWGAMLAALVLPLTYLWVRRREPGFAWPIVVATVGTVSFLDFATGNPLSEPVYLAATMGMLLWADRNQREEDPRADWWWILLGCLLLVALPALRTIGIAAVAAAGLAIVLPPWRSFRRQDVIPLVAGAGFVLAWFLWTRANGTVSYAGGGDGGYLHDFLLVNPHHPDLGRASFAQLLSRTLENVAIQTAHLGELLTPVPWVKPTWYSPLLLAIPLVLVGWWRDLRGGGRFPALYLACYLGILLGWPYDEGPRFLLVVAPLLWIYLLGGLRFLGEAIRADRSGVRIAGLLGSALAVVALLVVWKRTPEAFTRQDLAALGVWTLLLGVTAVGWKRLVRLLGGLEDRQVRTLGIGAIILLAAGSVLRAGPSIVQRARGAPPVAENPHALWEASEWILANTPDEAVIQTTYPTRIHFATGRPAVSLPVTEAAEPFLEIARRYHPAFVIVLDSDDPYVVPSDEVRFRVLQRLFPARWNRVHRFRGGSIYAFQ